MIRRNQTILNIINVVSDMLLVFVSYWIAFFIRFELMQGNTMIDMKGTEAVLMIVAYSFLTGLVYYACRLYHMQRMKKLGGAAVKIFLINGLGVMFWISLLYLMKQMDFSRHMLFMFWLISSFSVLGKHFVLRLILHYYRKSGYNQKHVVIVGNGHLAFQYLQDVKAHPEFGFTIDGYISAVAKEGLGEQLGSYEDLGRILEERHIDNIIVALEAHEAQYMPSVIAAADKEGVHVDLIPLFNDYYPAHPTIESMGGTRLINLRATPLDYIGWAFVKRTMDIVSALILIILTSPVMLIVAIAIKITSPGPILFKQERIGRNKKPFKMLKFRSMRIDIDHNGWSTNVDDRKTKVGAFIRKYSIDEFPQFFNVLVGQMSLVGPRPEIPRFVEQFKEEVPLYLVRQQIRPGITGWAQINGYRGDTSIKARVEHDIWYIENWSLALDLKIIWKTIFGGMINDEVM